MTEKLEILVVEDQPHHLADVRAVIDSRRQYGIEADYVSTLDDAKRKLEEKRYDGILSDVFFPEREGEEESASGLWIAEYGLENKVPFILVTSTYHHGRKTEEVNQQLRIKYKIGGLIDAEPEGCSPNTDLEVKKKNWKGGLLALAYFIEDSRERGWEDKWMFGAIQELILKINGEFAGRFQNYRDDKAPAVFTPKGSYGGVYEKFDRVLNTYCKDLFS